MPRTRPTPAGGEIERDAHGNHRNADRQAERGDLYGTLAKGQSCPSDYQLNSTRHFMRELNRLGITSVIDAGGRRQNYPQDYEVGRAPASRW